MRTSPTDNRLAPFLVLALLIPIARPAAAQTAPMPETLPRLGSATAPMVPTPPQARPSGVEPLAEPLTGDLGVELVAGIGGAGVAVLLGVATAHAQVGACAPGEGLCGLGATLQGVSVFILSAPVLVTAGVALAGRGTGGNGNVFWTALGASMGTVVGAMAGMRAFTLMSEPDDAPSMGARIAVAGAVASLPAVASAVLGYQLSADVPVQAMAVPALDGRGAMFTLSGAM